MLKNPFGDFRSTPLTEKALPFEDVVRDKDQVKARLEAGRRALVEAEAERMAWTVDFGRLVEIYDRAVKSLSGLESDAGDVDDAFVEIGSARDLIDRLPGPAELWLSALINRSQAAEIELDLSEFEKRFHFLGYRLPQGKTLILHGRAGDFIGAALAGGKLVVKGSAGNWLGAGMTAGEITVDGAVGRQTGQWMHGGRIQAAGPIEALGDQLYGGRIDQQDRLVYPGS